MAERHDASSSDEENTKGWLTSDDDTKNIPFTKNKGDGRAQVYTVAQLARRHPRVKTKDFPPWVHDCKVVNFDGCWDDDTSKKDRGLKSMHFTWHSLKTCSIAKNAHWPQKATIRLLCIHPAWTLHSPVSLLPELASLLL